MVDALCPALSDRSSLAGPCTNEQCAMTKLNVSVRMTQQPLEGDRLSMRQSRRFITRFASQMLKLVKLYPPQLNTLLKSTRSQAARF